MSTVQPNSLFRIVQCIVKCDRDNDVQCLFSDDVVDCYRAVNPMFGDYFQHDAHELLCCVLTHIDDAVTRLRQFSNSAVSAVSNCRLQSPVFTDCRLRSPASCHSFSRTGGFSRDVSVTTPPLRLLRSTSVQSTVTNERQAVMSAPSRLLRSRSVKSLSPAATNKQDGVTHDASVTTPPLRLLRSRSMQLAVTDKREAVMTAPSRLQRSRSVKSLSLAETNKQDGVTHESHDASVTTPPLRLLRSRSVKSPVTDKREGVMSAPSRLLRSRSVQSCQGMSRHDFATDKLGGVTRESHDLSVTTPPLRLLQSRSVQSLSRAVRNKPDRFIRHDRRSLPAPCISPVVDLCMPLKCASLSDLSASSPQQLPSTVTVSPDLQCERFRRKRKSSRSRSLPSKCSCLGDVSSQHQSSLTVNVSPDVQCERLGRKRKSSLISRPTKCSHVARSSCFGSLFDNFSEKCGPRTSGCSYEASFAGYSQTYVSSNEFVISTSGDYYQEDCDVSQLTDDIKSPGCSTGSIPVAAVDRCPLPVVPRTSVRDELSSNEFVISTSGDCCREDCDVTQLTDDIKLTDTADSIPVADGRCPQTSVRDELLLSLKAIENVRACNISLCCEDINGVSAEAASRHCRVLNGMRTCVVKHSVAERRHVACVQDMFAGQLLTQTKCLSCGSVAKHSERYEDVAVFTGQRLRNSM